MIDLLQLCTERSEAIYSNIIILWQQEHFCLKNNFKKTKSLPTSLICQVLSNF